MHPYAPNVILFDGDCGLCHRAVRFVLKKDRAGRFSYAPLKGDFAREVERRHAVALSEFDSIVVLSNAGSADERLAFRSDATVAVLKQLPGWKVVGAALGLVPKFMRDACYRWIAKHRLRFFGRSELCNLPTEETALRFLD